MDLVTVTYIDDLKDMLRQCRSINRFVKNPTTHFVIIQDNTLTIDQWHYLLSPYYKKHKLVLIPNNSGLDNYGGWVQSLKLKYSISQQVQSDYYLLLDSKNFFIKETDLNYWPIIEGAGQQLPKNWTECFIEFFSKKYNLPVPQNISNNITPYRIKTSTAKKILNTVNFQELLKDFYQEHSDHSPSGSVIYDFFADNIHFVDKLSQLPFMAIWKGSQQITKELLEYVDSNNNIKVFAIHRENDQSFESIKLVNEWCVKHQIDY
jgi:hypothetical protein